MFVWSLFFETTMCKFLDKEVEKFCKTVRVIKTFRDINESFIRDIYN